MIEVDIVKAESYIVYFIKGTYLYHREDGPALIYNNGYIMWCLNGKYFPTKASWFEALTESQKEKMLYSDYFIGG